ncbi:F-box domain-containing protein [Mycena chlorophos]|uniref:F-box domain-containing protein n=1 Tax=Mycena chlorophos TaxID=658473 RepID=A0A8H6TL18_MYCCL|nr:F-box domain-containing protein [Mycena chlorophos]
MEFPHLSSTNHVPLEAESRHICALIESAEDEQNRVRQELDETRAKERSLVKRDSVLAERIRSLKAMVSATRRTPPEILSSIFLLATGQSVDDLEVDQYDTEERDHARLPRATNARAFLRVSQICSRWRDVAQTTPLLWRTLRFNLRPFSDIHADGVVNLILHFAQLSQPYGLELDFYSHKEYTRGMPLAVLWSCGHQISSLELNVPGSALAPLIGLPAHALHKLKRLEINLSDATDSGLSGSIPGLACAQHLEDLKLVLRSMNFIDRLLPEPPSSSWNALRTLDLRSRHSINLSAVYSSLQSCHSLQQLALRMDEVDESSGKRFEGILRFENLVSFTLQIDYDNGEDDHMMTFVMPLFAPQLAALSLKGTFPLEAVAEFLEHSNMPPISTLRLESCVRGDTNLRGALLNVLRRVPLVETLALGLQLSPGVDDAFLRALTLQPGTAGIRTAEVFLPALRTLVIAESEGALNAGAVADMVESRQIHTGNLTAGTAGTLPGRCLESMTVSVLRVRRIWLHDVAWPRIAALESAGILHLSSSSSS